MGGDYIHVSQVLSMLYIHIYRIYDGVLCFSFVFLYFCNFFCLGIKLNISSI